MEKKKVKYELGKMWKWVCPSICMGNHQKKNDHYSQAVHQDLDLRSPEYERHSSHSDMTLFLSLLVKLRLLFKC